MKKFLMLLAIFTTFGCSEKPDSNTWNDTLSDCKGIAQYLKLQYEMSFRDRKAVCQVGFPNGGSIWLEDKEASGALRFYKFKTYMDLLIKYEKPLLVCMNKNKCKTAGSTGKIFVCSENCLKTVTGHSSREF